MKKIILALYLVFGCTSFVLADDGMVTLQSPYSAQMTIDRLEKILVDKGMTIFTRISHNEGAMKVGLELRPTVVLVFGNPKVGTPVMLCQQKAAIDFPQKALAWEDREGKVWLSYNDPQYLVERHQIKGCEEFIKKIKGALSKFANAAVLQEEE
ncbi:hypothetical protein MNBD_BACTEROID05-290 [hydrothermal vent metagenome]|uniref:DUF302 domain-containing protein n=1 Tax=hydrothermal vent metagenome TaxID=652676 RepID=A0A3B0T440_9ZZZZ